MTPESPAGGVAREWARAIRTTAFSPMSLAELQSLLAELLDDLVESLLAPEFSTRAGFEAGRRLVAADFTAERSIGRTVEVLGARLPDVPPLQGADGLAGRMPSLLGAVAAGFAAALRLRTLDQQETVKLALLRACDNAERELRGSESRFRELFTSSAVGMAISTPDGTLVEVNDALAEIVGIPAAELAGRPLHELFHADDIGQVRSAYQRLADGKDIRFRLQRQLRLLDADGEAAWTYLAVSQLHDSRGTPTRHVTMVENVTELHLLGDRLSHQSLHDSLTGLPNQQYFISRLEGVVGRGGQTPPITLCKIDLDGFAVVNDGLGRSVGDQLLKSVAARLVALVADEKATVARFGADEFAILIENSPTTPAVATLADDINTMLGEPVYIDGNGLAVSACIGVVEHRGGGVEPAELLRAAEATLHRVRSGGGARQWGLFDQHRDAQERASGLLAAVMPAAWENGEITLEYRPLARLADGAVVAVEALMRWDHRQRGPVPHEECLALAAHTGLVLPLGEWMLCSACEQLGSWREQLDGEVPALHVDLTAEQSHDPDLVSCVRRALAAGAMAAGRLQVSMPVPALESEQDEAEDNFRVLAGMGVRMALHGCGGAADLALVEDLQVSAVQIDRRLVRRVASQPADASAVASSLAAFVPLVRSRGISVTVGDLRTQDEVDWWRSVGADLAHGPFFAAPAAPDKIVALLGSGAAG